MMIDAICSTPNGDPAPHKVGRDSKDGPFSFILDYISAEDAPCESPTSDNINNGEQNTNKNKTLDESHHPLCEKAETEYPLEDENETGPVEQTSVSNINNPLDLETALRAENSGYIGQNAEALNEENANIQLAPLNSHLQTGPFPLVAGENVESIHVEVVSTDQDPPIPKNALKNTSNNTPAVINQLELEENPDGLSLSQPTGTTAHVKAHANTDRTQEPLSNTPINTSGMKETNENKAIIADTSASVESRHKSLLKTTDLFLDGLADDCDMTTEGARKTTTANTGLLSAEAKFSETNTQIAEADLDKRASTEETISDLMSPKSQETTYTENVLSNAAGSKEFNMNEFHTSLAQPEGQNRSTDNNNLRTNLEPIHIQNDNPSPMTQESLFSADNAKTNPLPDQPSPNEISADAGKQILESIQSSLNHRDGDQQITVRLNPPELGKVFIKIQEQNSELTGLLEVSKAETKVEIEQALPQMIRDLADCGIQIKRLDIMLSEDNRSEHGAREDQSSQNNESPEQDASPSETWDNDTYTDGINDWPPNNKNYEPISELQQMLVNDGSINVLI